jgi:oligoendopeptidase F
MAVTSPSASGIRWDLSDLASGTDAARLEWAELLEWGRRLAERHHGSVGSLGAPGLRALLEELDLLRETADRVEFYGRAREHTDVTDPETNDLVTLARQHAADLKNLLLFVELEWLALDDAVAEALLADPELAPYAHRLRVAREEKPYMLGEAEEQALNARLPVLSAWESLHGRELATLTVEFDAGQGPEPHTIDALLAYLYRPERELRLAALEKLFSALSPRADVLAACYDALVGDRLAIDRLRGIPHPMVPTNIRNELAGGVVETMLATVEEHYALGRRWFQRKAAALGLERLELADQYAPLGAGREVGWQEAVAIVDESLADFEPRLAEIFRACLERRHVDAEPRPGKAGGAYCNGISRSVLPYVLLNHMDTLRDVVTLAHEFGHATSDVLALEHQPYRSWQGGIAVAEIPSTFTQLLAVERLLEREQDPATRAVLLADRVEDAAASIFRQTVLARFEQRAYALRGEGKALTSARLAELWTAENERYYGAAIALPEGYGDAWSYIPHFIQVRFYTYAYSFAHLIAFLLLRRYHADPVAFTPAYLEFLAAGGSLSPQQLLEPMGVDLGHPGTWSEAFAEFERCVVEAEQALSALAA